MHVHFVIHESFEAPGVYETWVKERGHSASFSRVHAHEPLPQDITPIDLLVVMGGPQSPTTTLEECAHFDSAAEQALIRRCHAAGKAVVGVCLGAQLIGQALGGQCGASPAKEIGNFPITLSEIGRQHAKFAHFDDSLVVGHWHNDMPGLTDTASIIASSAGCPRQIIEYDRLVYGFQCHMELTAELVELLIAASAHEWSNPILPPFVQVPAALRGHDYRSMNQALYGFLDNLMADYAVCNTTS